MTTVESQIIDLQNKMDELQRKQQEIHFLLMKKKIYC